MVEGNEPSTTSKKDNGVTMEIKPGEDIHVSQKIVSLLSDCLYYNLEAGAQYPHAESVLDKPHAEPAPSLYR